MKKRMKADGIKRPTQRKKCSCDTHKHFPPFFTPPPAQPPFFSQSNSVHKKKVSNAKNWKSRGNNTNNDRISHSPQENKCSYNTHEHFPPPRTPHNPFLLSLQRVFQNLKKNHKKIVQDIFIQKSNPASPRIDSQAESVTGIYRTYALDRGFDFSFPDQSLFCGGGGGERWYGMWCVRRVGVMKMEEERFF